MLAIFILFNLMENKGKSDKFINQIWQKRIFKFKFYFLFIFLFPFSRDFQRIQLLQNIDMDYYKMLKSNLKMENENTKKNYLFLQNIQRTKYSSRNSIL